ncbi:class I SAM-dependent methyltransferase [Candidatus Hydrogenosomobacter endosymbioticus]|nr:class I SAM-dependent methyltransferase [Candidatus Hydrogenosomobacter endosymbioticus]
MGRELSSFRDPEGFVFLDKGKIKRFLSSEAAVSRMRDFLTSDVYQRKLKGLLIDTCMLDNILVHERVPVVTYPYEWSFSMLANAALTQLSIMEELVPNGYILKDGSAYNCLYHKGDMVFIDILSIGKVDKELLWNGYHQFCEHFLYPLMLKAYKKINFQDWWVGCGDGISTQNFRNLLTKADLFKKGVFLHVFVKSALNKMVSRETVIDKKGLQNRSAESSIIKLVKNLKDVVQYLKEYRSSSMWTDYSESNSYSQSDREEKHKFVKRFVSSYEISQLVDLGCNTGEYSEVAAEHVPHVISVDYDQDCIDQIYLKIQQGKVSSRIVPVVGNIVHLSPSIGWNLEERRGLLYRLKSDAFLAVALIHHICISNNVPLEYFVMFLREIGEVGVVEWIDIDDPMVRVLLKNRENVFSGYTWENFKSIVEKYFFIKEVYEFSGMKRKLCLLEGR